MNFNFNDVLSRAWKITWKYKVLWIFGMLASCGQGGNNSSNFRNSYDSGTSPMNSEMARQFTEAIESMTTWFSNNMWALYALGALFILMILAQIFLNTVGEIGLVRGAYHADGGAETLAFGTLFSESLRYFWRMIGLGLLIWLPFFILFFGAFFALLFSSLGSAYGDNYSEFGSYFVLFIIGFCCCLIPLLLLLGLCHQVASRALLVDDLGILASIQRGWRLFTGNLVTLFGIWFMLLIIGLVGGIVIALPYLIAILPLMFDFMEGTIQSWQPFINAGIFMLCYFPIFWFLSGVLRTYTETVWTLTYLEIRPTPESPIVLPVEANA
jgi:hypothetical protein